MHFDVETLESQPQPETPPVLETTHNGVYWVHYTGASQPNPIPVPNADHKIVTFARDGRMFIRIYLGSPKQQSPEEDADDEYDFAKDDVDSRSATPHDDGYMFVAGSRPSVDWQTDVPERLVFSSVNWNQTSPGAASLDESVPPDENLKLLSVEQSRTSYNQRIGEAGGDAMDVDENCDQYARFLSGETAVRKSRTPFHKEISAFAPAVARAWSPIKEEDYVSSIRNKRKPQDTC
jgi:hypothetical protein